eukprot:SAG11_NODE_14_length_26344_cov_14.209411_2_plen_266_part_00
MQGFVVGSVQLYANLCASYREAQKEVTKIMPEDLVKAIITGMKPEEIRNCQGTEDDSDLCDELRVACCDLLYRLYVDADGNLPIMPLNLTRKFEEIVDTNATFLNLRDDYPYPDIKRWIVVFLEQKQHSTELTASLVNARRNKFIVAIVTLVERFLVFGIYTEVDELEKVLRPLLKILDGTNDKPDIEEFEKNGARCGGPWRFSEVEKNVDLMQAKTIICKILIFVQQSRLNLRMTQTLLTFRGQLDKLRSRQAGEGTYNETQVR